MVRKKERVLVALSGGVDSSVAAHLLQREGFDVETAYIRTWNNESELGECPAQEDIDAAGAASSHLGIPFRIINLVTEYRDRVVSYLVDGYRRGITPNPDIMCNREMKFGVFREIAEAEGFDSIATGHYCRSARTVDGLFHLLEGIDKNKDQSYFLALTRLSQLEHCHFPVGSFPKESVRVMAREAGLPNANKKDSQGICFLGKVKIDEFLSEYIPDSPGAIVNAEGKILGEHRGLHRYTIGQRKGIGVPSNTDNEAYVVVAKDFKNNCLRVAFDRPDTPDLYHSRVRIGSLNWIGTPVHEGESLTAKPRYRDPHQTVRASEITGDSIGIEFQKPQRALALGQILALYRGEALIGGGVYQEIS